MTAPPSIVDVERQQDFTGTYIHKNAKILQWYYSIYIASLLIALLNSKLIKYFVKPEQSLNYAR